MKKLPISVIASLVLASTSLLAMDKGVNNLVNTILSQKPINTQSTKNKSEKPSLQINQTKIQSDQIIVKVAPGVKIDTYINSIAQKTNQTIKKVKEFKLRKPGVNINNSDSIVVIKIEDKSKLKETIEQLKTIPGVLNATEDKIIQIDMVPNDPKYDDLWGMKKINAPIAWNASQGDDSYGVVVGVIDTGVDYNHVDLKDNMWINIAEANGTPGVDDDGNGYVDDIYGIDVVNNDSDPMDDHGHGTHVSGTIGAVGNNSEGVVGVNWHTRIAACKFLNSNGSGYTSGAIECVNYFNTLKEEGYNIVAVNNSWGGGGYDENLYDALSVANDLGIIHVCAAGNDGTDNDSDPHYPSSYDLPNIIAVAATDENDELADFSNYGATSVDLAAPGVNILSTLPQSSSCETNETSETVYQNNFESEDSLNNWYFLSLDITEPFEDMENLHWQRVNSGYDSQWSMSDSPEGNYVDYTLQNMITPVLDLSKLNLKDNECLAVKYKIKGESEYGYDPLLVYVTGDNGENWNYIGGVSGTFDDWTTITTDQVPDDVVSDNFKIAFVKYNDCCINYDGYNLDDVVLVKGEKIITNNYGSYSGTSMATPHVTGAVALAASLYDENLTQRVQRILNGVDKLDNLEGKVVTGGRLNLAKVLQINNANVGIKTLSITSRWDTYSWDDVNYTLKDSLPVIIAGPLSFNGKDGAVVRIKDISPDGFSIRVKEWNYLDGNHKNENVSILVAEPGRYMLPDGNVIEIGTFELSGTGKFKSVNFSQAFENTPYLFLTVNTFNGPHTVVVRAKDVNNTGFKAAFFEEEDLMNSGHYPETVAYMAIYAPDGNGTIPLSNDVQLPYTVKQVQIASKWDTAISPYEFLVQEEQSLDEERAHVYENIDVLLINNSEIFGQDVSTKGKDPAALRYKKAE